MQSLLLTKKELKSTPFLILEASSQRFFILLSKIVMIFGFVLCTSPQSVFASEKLCNYSTYRWNTNLKKAVDIKQVKRPYSSLKSNEIDPQTGCSLCIEDQALISIGKIKPFRVCKAFASAVHQELQRLIQSGEVINKVIGYRVGRTKGSVDRFGNRTQFSNHSFGIAIDINDQQNGLYDRCVTFGSHCRLIKGGQWKPDDKASLTAKSPIVLSMKKLGFKWGGEIKGKQKDFMHFSLSGY